MTNEALFIETLSDFNVTSSRLYMNIFTVGTWWIEQSCVHFTSWLYGFSEAAEWFVYEALLTRFSSLQCGGGIGDSGRGALVGILECVRLSAGLCLDKAAHPLSLMPQLGWGMPPCSWNRRTAERCHAFWGQGRSGEPCPADYTTPQQQWARPIVWSHS